MVRGIIKMIINDVKVGKITVPLKKPFLIGDRPYNYSKEVILKIITDGGEIGFGSAAPAPRVTGETEDSIVGAIKHIAQHIKGMDISCLECITKTIDECIKGNNSAKAAFDMALYDLAAKRANIPLFKLLGGYNSEILTDMTIQYDTVENMVSAAYDAVRDGYSNIKIKLGKDPEHDLERVKLLRKAIRKGIKVRVDGNQGWSPKEAVKIIRKIEELDLDIEFVEQPVKAWDIEGLKFVKENVDTLILADESVFATPEAFKIIQNRACDLINIKLMKSGGIHNAMKIYNMADTMGIKCMMGCMLESKVVITAAASFAAAKSNMIISDLDTMLYFSEDPIVGGATIEGNRIVLSEEPGLGITDIIGWEEITI